MAIRTSGRTTPGIPGPGPGILSGTMSTPDSSSNAQVIDPTGISVNGIENRGNAGIAVHSTGHLGQSSLRMNNGDFNRPEILPMGTGFHNSSPKKNNFQSRLAHFQQLALNNTIPPSTREIQTNNAPPSTKFRNFTIPVSIREVDPVDSVPAPSLPEKIKPPNINTLFNTREIHPIDTTLNAAERFKYDTPQPSPRQSLSLNPASIVTGLRKPPGNDFQARLAHFRELALNSKNDADFIPQVGTGRRYSCNVMTAPPSPIQLEHFAFHKSGAASVINMPTTTNLLQSEIDSTPPTNIIAQGNPSTTIKSNGLAAPNDQLRAGIADTLSVPPPKDKDAHNLGASVVPRSTPARKVVPAPKAVSIEKEIPRYPITLSPAPPDVTEHQLVKTIRNARSPGPVPLKAYRPTIAAVSSPPVEPKPRIRVPGRKDANAARPSRRNRKAMNEYQQMPAVLMLMHDRSKSFSQAKMDIACAAAAEICETPLTFADFSLCRPEDRKIDITGHVRSSISLFSLSLLLS